MMQATIFRCAKCGKLFVFNAGVEHRSLAIWLEQVPREKLTVLEPRVIYDICGPCADEILKAMPFKDDGLDMPIEIKETSEIRGR